MHILMIISRYCPYIGGAEKQAERMARALVSRGYRVTVLTRKWGNESSQNLKDGIQVIRLPFLDWGSLAPLTFMCCCLAYILWHKSRIHLLHAHQPDSVFTAAIAKIITGIPVVAHFHGALPIQGEGGRVLAQGRKGKFMLRVVRKNTDIIIAVSQQVAQELFLAGLQKNIHVLPNGVDVCQFYPVQEDEKVLLRRRLNIPSEAVVFVFSGRLEKVKGIDVLLQAWSIVEKQLSPASTLVILGTGPLVGETRNFIEGRRSCQLRGIVQNVQDYLRAADVFVMPSRYEGTSLAVLEAMACGLPVLLTRVGGNIDIVSHLTDGVLIPPENSGILAEWIKTLHTDRALRCSLGEAGRQTVVQRFAFDSVMDLYYSILPFGQQR